MQEVDNTDDDIIRNMTDDQVNRFINDNRKKINKIAKVMIKYDEDGDYPWGQWDQNFYLEFLDDADIFNLANEFMRVENKKSKKESKKDDEKKYRDQNDSENEESQDNCKKIHSKKDSQKNSKINSKSKKDTEKSPKPKKIQRKIQKQEDERIKILEQQIAKRVAEKSLSNTSDTQPVEELTNTY